MRDVEHGDFVKCSDCEAVSVIEVGGEICPICGSHNLSWVNDEKQEVDVSDIEKQYQHQWIFSINIDLPFSGFYETVWYSSDALICEIQEDAINLGISSEEWEEKYDFDAAKFFQDTTEEYALQFKANFLNEIPGVLAMSEPCLQQPHDYFYGTDKINVDINVTWDFFEFLEKFIQDNYNELRDSIREDWRTCDGFWSFLSNDIEDWRAEMYHDDRYIQELLRYYINMNFSGWEEELLELVSPCYCSYFYEIKKEEK